MLVLISLKWNDCNLLFYFTHEYDKRCFKCVSLHNIQKINTVMVNTKLTYPLRTLESAQGTHTPPTSTPGATCSWSERNVKLYLKLNSNWITRVTLNQKAAVTVCQCVVCRLCACRLLYHCQPQNKNTHEYKPDL